MGKGAPGGGWERGGGGVLEMAPKCYVFIYYYFYYFYVSVFSLLFIKNSG